MIGRYYIIAIGKERYTQMKNYIVTNDDKELGVFDTIKKAAEFIKKCQEQQPDEQYKVIIEEC